MNFYTLLICASLSSIVVGCEAEPVLTFDEFCDSRELSLCDISQPSCNQPLSEFVACLRERPLAEVPQFEVISEDEARARYVTFLDSERAQNREHLITALELFDRFPSTRPTREERIESQMKFNMTMNESGLITLVANGDGFASESNYFDFVQLLTLSMLRQEYDLNALNDVEAEGDPSRLSALNAVIAGTQILYANMVRSALEKTSYWRINWSSIWQQDRRDTAFGLFTGETGLGRYVGRQAPVPHYLGAQAVHRAWYFDQTFGVEQLLKSPPTFTDPSPTHLIVDAQPVLLRTLSDFTQVSDFVMGSWFTPYFLFRLLPQEEELYPLRTSSWSADRLWVFHNSASETTAAIWIWVPDRTGNAEDWAESLADYASENEKPWFVSTSVVDGQDVLALVVCDNPTLLPLWESEALRLLNTLELRSSDTASTL